MCSHTPAPPFSREWWGRLTSLVARVPVAPVHRRCPRSTYELCHTSRVWRRGRRGHRQRATLCGSVETLLSSCPADDFSARSQAGDSRGFDRTYFKDYDSDLLGHRARAGAALFNHPTLSRGQQRVLVHDGALAVRDVCVCFCMCSGRALAPRMAALGERSQGAYGCLNALADRKGGRIISGRDNNVIIIIKSYK